MIISGAEDLRVKRTVLIIQKVFDEMLNETDYSQITVKALCDRAMINKKTFYRYYASLDDLLAEYQLKYIKMYLKQTEGLSLPKDAKKLQREFFLFNESQNETFQKVTVSDSCREISRKMKSKVLSGHRKRSAGYEHLTDFQYQLVTETTSFIGMTAYSVWVRGGRKDSMDDVIEFTTRLLTGGLSAVAEVD